MTRIPAAMSPDRSERAVRELNRLFPGGAWNLTEIKTGAYTAKVGEMVRVNAAVTITLPLAANLGGRSILVCNMTGGNITVAATSGNSLNGSGTVATTLSVRWTSDNGTVWYRN